MKLKEEIRAICKYYGVKVNFSRNSQGCCGFSDYNIYKIIVTPKGLQSREVALTTVFHELGHIHCHENNLYRGYHYTKEYRNLTKEDKRILRLTGFKAECYVEKWGKQEMKKYYPYIKYCMFYGDEYSRKWLNNSYLNVYF